VTRGLAWGCACGLVAAVALDLLLIAAGVGHLLSVCSGAFVCGGVIAVVRTRVDPERVPGWGKYWWSEERRAAKRRLSAGQPWRAEGPSPARGAPGPVAEGGQGPPIPDHEMAAGWPATIGSFVLRWFCRSVGVVVAGIMLVEAVAARTATGPGRAGRWSGRPPVGPLAKSGASARVDTSWLRILSA